MSIDWSDGRLMFEPTIRLDSPLPPYGGIYVISKGRNGLWPLYVGETASFRERLDSGHGEIDC